ncbi:ribosome biogenesis GTPase [Scopulibacillus darangshiensis]|uniref:Small ribosomal subunit biogenesis GTPase RsgA n=1 Tax=Scopulibacillus darangshiensis TaxID=442528 RepID=A0A4R2P307_9BACL|nr:ribosome small subunit-dependent GTPase A [Scopulibacillus darangshiensis]TCP29133.1 ribosome biogenesis GTPase [Scopulibacillus darangshiensis]
MTEGRIIKALSGFYYVKTGDEVYQCRGRGNFRKKKISPLVGDKVTYEAENPTDGYILSIGERRNELNRPPIANVDQAILVFSSLEPNFDDLLLDRFLVHIESHAINPLICITKLDLVNEEEKNMILAHADLYRRIGYTVLLTSSETGEGINVLRPFLDEHISVVAGQSGVGKSSLLNALDTTFNILTDSISSSLGRGKHTTRHVELLPVGTGYVADTPGFSSLEFSKIEADELAGCFREMDRLSSECKFRGCTHLTEPGCAVKAGLQDGTVSKSRYSHYKQFYDEIKSRKRRY